MTDAADESPEDTTESTNSHWILPGILAVLLAVAIGIAAWLWSEIQTPSSGSADAGFARDMSDHHAQAVEMALIAFERTEDPEIRQIAYDIATSQQAQIGMMTGWMNIWDLSSARDGAPMAWVGSDSMEGHDMSTGEVQNVEDMPGMISRDQIEILNTLDPADMDIQFLTLMIDHHEGGVLMAEAAVDKAEEDVVLDLANSIVVSQTAEIANMTAMLEDRGAA